MLKRDAKAAGMIDNLLIYKKDFLDARMRRPVQPAFLSDLTKEVKDICSTSNSNHIQSMYVVDDPDLLHFKCKTFSDYHILKKTVGPCQ